MRQRTDKTLASNQLQISLSRKVINWKFLWTEKNAMVHCISIRREQNQDLGKVKKNTKNSSIGSDVALKWKDSYLILWWSTRDPRSKRQQIKIDRLPPTFTGAVLWWKSKLVPRVRALGGTCAWYEIQLSPLFINSKQQVVRSRGSSVRSASVKVIQNTSKSRTEQTGIDSIVGHLVEVMIRSLLVHPAILQ